MSTLVQDALIDNNDDYRPIVVKPELQQWDNYQINDLYCNDIDYLPIVISGITVSPPPSLIFKNFLAVEKACIYPAIECDFEAIAVAYP
jgi:hypothetical protein